MIKIMNILALVFGVSANAIELPNSQRSLSAIDRNIGILDRRLEKKGLSLGAPIFIRIFKDPAILELWVQKGDSSFTLFNTYSVCSFSGDFGPKLKEGDFQSPEGFYYVTPERLNPWSQFHLSFNLGFPNEYDRYHGRTGSALMVHGDCVSAGCYAMTDEKIEEIYTLAHASLASGQKYFRVHVFPFRLEENRLKEYLGNAWLPFWQNLKEGYDLFEENKVPPNVEVVQGKYIFQ
ncbi:murein L,D-transpeptidase family protein [Microbulbifer sp. GL-2]|uniref:L,D-transpeptidase family protein n=1 Tax=Microbulbifer sp. GL-2 TaxID=2591606 RepID=UPI0011621E8E|nr:murein L,D-transpeptidase family protein [Microbulbifer sp. GL-2]BBM02479.1 hypothetical protein GL2_25530 [Microbulbifer sp. GL-2]